MGQTDTDHRQSVLVGRTSVLSQMTAVRMEGSTALLLDMLRPLLHAGGFSLLSAFSAGQYNNHPKIKELDKEYHLAGCADTDCCILVGSTSSLWHPFIDFLGANSDFVQHTQPHVLDAYSVQLVEQAVAALDPSSRARLRKVYYAHETVETHGRCMSFSTAAHVSGMAAYVPQVQRCIHATHGPWVGLRAILTFDQFHSEHDLVAEANANRSAGFLCSKEEIERVQARQSEVASAWGSVSEEESWAGLVDVADTFELGRNWRYCQTQVDFHYAPSDTARQLVLNQAILRSIE